MESLNCSAVVMKPREGIKNWLKKIAMHHNVFPVVVTQANTEDLQVDNPVFLIPTVEKAQSFVSFFDKYGAEMFEIALAGWCKDESLWPEDRSYNNFVTMFSIELHGLVFSDIEPKKENNNKSA
jgi:hypothetical protein